MTGRAGKSPLITSGRAFVSGHSGYCTEPGDPFLSTVFEFGLVRYCIRNSTAFFLETKKNLQISRKHVQNFGNNISLALPLYRLWFWRWGRSVALAVFSGGFCFRLARGSFEDMAGGGKESGRGFWAFVEVLRA
jgi:hypothetical protein